MRCPFLFTLCICLPINSSAIIHGKDLTVIGDRIGWIGIAKQSSWNVRKFPENKTALHPKIIDGIPRGGHQEYSEETEDEKKFPSDNDSNRESSTYILSDSEDSDLQEFQNEGEEVELGESFEDDEDNHVQIIPFDDDVGESYTESVPEVQIIPFDDDVGEYPVEGVEENIIPFDEDVGEPHDESSTAQSQAFDADDISESNTDDNEDIGSITLGSDESKDTHKIETEAFIKCDENQYDFDDESDNDRENVEGVASDERFHRDEGDKKSKAHAQAEPLSEATMSGSHYTEKDNKKEIEPEPNLICDNNANFAPDTAIQEEVGENEDSIVDEPLKDVDGFKSISETSDLFRRIWTHLKEWEENDAKSRDENDESRRVRALIHQRAHDYVSELLEFERSCFLSLAQGASLPKSAPHPKKVLHYIAPKLHAVLHSPDIMLRIRSAQPIDVGAAATAIGVIAAIKDLYEELGKYIDSACKTGQRHGFNCQNVCDDIAKDRRFEQLLECVSCGVDIRRRTKEYKDLIQSTSDTEIDENKAHEKYENGHDSEEKESVSTAVADEDGQLTESISVSDIARLVFGITAFGLEKERVIDAFNTTDYIAALGIRANELLQRSCNVRYISDCDPDGKSALAKDIAECTVAFSAAGEFFSAKLQFIILNCVKLLGEDMKSQNEGRGISDEDHSPTVEEDIQIDEIVDRLAMSEVEPSDPLQNDRALNATGNEAVEEVKHESADNETNTAMSACSLDVLMDYLCRKDRMAVLKALTVRRFSGELINSPTISNLLEVALSEMFTDVRKIRSSNQENSDEGIGIKCVDAAILLSSVARSDEKENLLDTSYDISLVTNDSLLESSVVGYEKGYKQHGKNRKTLEPTDFSSSSTQKYSSLMKCIGLPCNLSDLERDEFNISLGIMAADLIVNESSERFILPSGSAPGILSEKRTETKAESNHIFPLGMKARLEYERKMKLTFVTTLQDLCIIIKVASEIHSAKAAAPILESCLVLVETIGYEDLHRLDNFDVVNFIHGSALVLSSITISQTAAEKLSSFILFSLRREFDLMTSSDLFRLLWSVASIGSTQSYLCIKEMIKDSVVQDLIEHGLNRMKGEIGSASLTELSTVLWSFAECYKSQDDMSMVDHFETFELLGGCIAAASSYADASERDIGFSAMCKVAFATSVLNLGAHDFVSTMLHNFYKSPSLVDSINMMDMMHFFFSVAKSESKHLFVAHGSYETLMQNMIGRMNRLVPTQGLTPRNFALLVWSLGRVFPRGASERYHEVPVYTREQLSILSPQKSAQLIDGISSFFDAKSIRTNTKLQLVLKNILLHIQHILKNMKTAELITVARALAIVQSKCDDDLIKEGMHQEEKNRDNVEPLDTGFELDENPLSDEEEENVISSLFPSSNQKDIFLLCENILIGIGEQVKRNLSTFSSSEMKDIINMLKDANIQDNLMNDIKLEIERRTSLLKSRLYHEMNEIYDCPANDSANDANDSSYKSKIRKLFGRKTIEDDKLEKKIDTEDNEFRDVLRLVRLTKDSDELHHAMLQDAQRIASELGQCSRLLIPIRGEQILFQRRNRKSLLYPR